MAVPADTGVNPHSGPWTIEDLLALPEDRTQRHELVDGLLVVSPNGTRRHQRLLGRACRALEKAIPDGLEATLDINVELSSDRLLIPDFTVARDPDSDALVTPADQVLLVGEVVSPSSRNYDRIAKRRMYAEAGIPYYLLVEGQRETVEIIAYELVHGRYREYARSEGGRLSLTLPFPIELDLSGC